MRPPKNSPQPPPPPAINNERSPTTLCDRSRKLAAHSQPSMTDRNLVTQDFELNSLHIVASGLQSNRKPKVRILHPLKGS